VALVIIVEVQQQLGEKAGLTREHKVVTPSNMQ
jgi:hypothetical protein